MRVHMLEKDFGPVDLILTFNSIGYENAFVFYNEFKLDRMHG